jgi:hypothetical protein
VGIESNVYGFFNFLLKDGSKSDQDTKKTDMTLRMISEERIARRIDLYHEELELYGERVNCIMVYDKNSQRLLDAGYDEQDDKVSRIDLEADERVVGVKSRVLSDRPAAHLDI